MDNKQLNNPLHGIKLSEIVEYLYNEYGWEKLGKKIKINSFTKDPSIKSSLKFLRKTDWARKEVEDLYLWNLRRNATRKPFAKRVFVKKVAVVKKNNIWILKLVNFLGYQKVTKNEIYYDVIKNHFKVNVKNYFYLKLMIKN